MNVDVWVFYPEDHPLSTDLKRAIGNQVEARGWNMQVRPVAEVRVAGGRPMLTVAPRDATAIYKRAHRAFVSVLIAGRPVVRVDPSRNLSARHAMELERFVRYKCLAQRIAASDGLVNVRAYLANAEHWIQRVLCDGENDPRVLPLHMFVPDEDQTALGRRPDAEALTCGSDEGAGRTRSERFGCVPAYFTGVRPSLCRAEHWWQDSIGMFRTTVVPRAGLRQRAGSGS